MQFGFKLPPSGSLCPRMVCTRCRIIGVVGRTVVLTHLGLVGIFLLLLFNAAQVREMSVVTPQEFEIAFPKVIDWIQKTLLTHKRFARSVTSKNFKRLPLYFSPAQIEAAKYVVVDRIPIPPLSSIGLSRFAEFERGDYGGITYLDTYFLKKAGADDESLHFHEMVHVVQWRLLGAERFLALYANGLDGFGYRNSPLEKMAYDAQESFDHGMALFDAEELVREKLANLSMSLP